MEWDRNPEGVVVLSTKSATVKVTPVSHNGDVHVPHRRDSRSPESRCPNFGIPQEERDRDLERWVAEARRRHQEEELREENHKMSVIEPPAGPAPLVSMETLSDAEKCDHGCLPKGNGVSEVRIRRSRSPTLNSRGIPERPRSKSPMLVRQDAVDKPSSSELSRQTTQDSGEDANRLPNSTASVLRNTAVVLQKKSTSSTQNSSFIPQSSSLPIQTSAQSTHNHKHAANCLPARSENVLNSDNARDSIIDNRTAAAQPQPQTNGITPRLNGGIHAETDDPAENLTGPEEHSPREQDQSNHRATSLHIPPPLPPPDTVPGGDLGPPPPYTPPSLEDWKLIHIDFPPKCLDGGGILSTSVFDTYDRLMERANQWLRRHPSARVKCVETVEQRTADVPATGQYAQVDSPTVPEVEAAGALSLKALRVWIEPKPFYSRHLPPEQLGYINVVPACISPGGVSHRPQFDSQLVTLHKFNKIMKHRPMPGRVVSVELIPLKFRQYSKWVEPDRCHYRQHNDISTVYLSMFRVFYEVGVASHDEIGYRDFKPAWRESGSGRRRGGRVFDDFSVLVQEADQWAHSVPDLRILNYQTLTCKVKLTKNKRAYINTERSINTIYNSSDQVHVLRVWYTLPPTTPHSASTPLFPQPHDSHPSSPHRSISNPPEVHDQDYRPTNRLACKVFYPLRTDPGGLFDGQQYEALADTRQRMKRWLQSNAGVRVLSAESTRLKMDSNVISSHQVNLTYFPARCDGSHSWINVFRLYLDADFRNTMHSSEDEASSSADDSLRLRDKPPCVLL